jgi:hypothetical protein
MNRESEVALAAIRAVEERDAETLFGLCLRSQGPA